MILTRLKEFIDANNLNISAFEKSIGMSNASFRKSLKNNGAIGSDKLENILKIYPDINPDWLLTGRGSMLRKDNTTQSDNPLLYKDEQNKEMTATQAERGIPLIPEHAFAGFASGNNTQILECDCEHYIIPRFNGADGLIQVKGSSMYPKYSSGDIVAFKKLPLNTFFQWNKVYILDTEQGILIKRVKKSQDPDSILCVSDNPAYDPFPLRLSEIYSLAIVIGVIRLE